jgi:hypothetical protein
VCGLSRVVDGGVGSYGLRRVVDNCWLVCGLSRVVDGGVGSYGLRRVVDVIGSCAASVEWLTVELARMASVEWLTVEWARMASVE